MKTKTKTLIISIAIPLAVGGISALLTMGAMKDFASLNQPPLSPPGWLFGVVWTVLYTLMGIASYLALRKGGPQQLTTTSLRLYALQLLFNFAWSIFFFNLNLYIFSFVWLVVLWILILATTVAFYKLRPLAGILMIPYLLWVLFAGYLNLGIALLN